MMTSYERALRFWLKEMGQVARIHQLHPYLYRELDQLAVEMSTHMTDRESRIVVWRYGLDGGLPMTFKEIGELLGVTAGRVRQIHTRALQRLAQA